MVLIHTVMCMPNEGDSLQESFCGFGVDRDTFNKTETPFLLAKVSTLLYGDS